MQIPGNPPLNGPAVIDMWLDAAEGDASGMALVTLAMDLLMPKLVNWGHFLAMGTSAPDLIDPARDYQTELSQPGTILGSPMSLLLWGVAQGWPATPDQQRYFEAQDSDVETLLISGSIDFSTPPQYARDELLPHLSKGHQVILKDIGHTASFLNSQPQARSRLLSTYFDSGQVDDSLYEYQAPVFDVDKSWGGMAKMALAVLVLVLSTVILLMVVIGRKLRRKFAFRALAEA
jgi:hypothetical protein